MNKNKCYNSLHNLNYRMNIFTVNTSTLLAHKVFQSPELTNAKRNTLTQHGKS